MATRVLGLLLSLMVVGTPTLAMDTAVSATSLAITTPITQETDADETPSEKDAAAAPKAAAEDAAKGLDEKIDAWFTPIADWWDKLVLTAIPGLTLGEAGSSVPIVLAMLVIGAVFFTVYYAFVNIRLFPLAINVVRGKYDELEGGNEPITTDTVNVVDGDVKRTIRDEGDGEVSHFQALATAVSGTVGLGNISGVAVAVATGGPGATFWMIMCGLLGMCTKFVECTLGVKYRDVGEDGTVYGGPMYYLTKGIGGGFGKVLGIIFAVLCVGASFGGGNAFQSNQASKQIISLFGLTGGSIGFILGIILAVFVGLVILGGIKRIASVTEKIVPLMAIIYVLACIVIICMNLQHVGTAFSQIISGAFTPQAGLGGLVGVLLVGFQRAAFSNEAGAGSAAIAHSAVKTKFPASEGIVALLEPFIDTVVICTMTALVIVFFNIDGTVFDYGNTADSKVTLTAPVEGQPAAIGGVDLTSAAFESQISWFPKILTIAVCLFALSTMISWSYYGLQAWKFLFGKTKAADITFKVLFLIFIVIGASVKLDAVIKFSDAMILALVFPNMVGLIILAPKVKEELGKYLGAIRSSKS